jgi:hypothetical protein
MHHHRSRPLRRAGWRGILVVVLAVLLVTGVHTIGRCGQTTRCGLPGGPAAPRVHCGLEIVPCTMTCSVRVAVEGYPRWADAVLGSIQGGGVQGALRAAAARCEVGETTTSCTSMARLVTSQPSPAGAPPDQQRVEIMPFEETAACSSQVDTCMPYHYVGWLVLSRTRGGA